MTSHVAEAGNGQAASAGTSAMLPSIWRLALVSTRLELKAFFREKGAIAFVFSLPAVLLLLLGSILKNLAAAPGSPITMGQLLAAGLIGGGIAATSFQYLGIAIATERDRLWLKRLRGTPMPRVAYFLGKIGEVIVSTLAETVLLIVVGILVDHITLPSTAGQWWTVAWVLILGATCCTLLGIAASSVPRSARSALGVITMPFVVLQFISGVYVPQTLVPSWLGDIAAYFPLKWITQGLRSAFLPSSAAQLEPSHTWEHGRIALVLAAWTVAGLVLCMTTFRWRNRSDG